MSAEKIVVLVGYSGHAFVAAEVILQAGYKLAGYLEKKELLLNPFDLEYMGHEGDENVMKTLNSYLFFPAIGSNSIRRNIVKALHESGHRFLTATHPKANISNRAEIGEGTLVCQGANINPLVQIGKAVIINTGAVVEHECQIGDFAHIAPGAVLAGNVTIGECAFIGANAVVKQGVEIGKGVLVGAGTVVLHDLDDYQTYVGNPAKKLLR